MTTVFEVMAELREWNSTNRDAGTAFEHLVLQFLTTDPLYAERFTEVWLWQDWPDRGGKTDTGIDLVAATADGGLCAIQAKFYEPEHYLQKGDIDSFLAASGKSGFTERLIVSTTDKWSSNAEDTLEDQQVPVARIGVSDLADSGVDWSAFRLDTGSGLVVSEKYPPRPHQEAAIGAVLEGWETSDRGKLIMACGTGKTLTALRLTERVVEARKAKGVAAQVLFLVPSIALVNQTLREWTSQALVPMRSFAVCSDTKVGKRTAGEDLRAHDLAFPATTDPVKLRTQVAKADETTALTVIFSTYQSIDVVAQAQQAGLGAFDLIICDEAHRTTGVTLEGEDESSFVRVHDDGYLQSRRRLYMTATPRLFDENTKAKAADADALLCSMDDESLYGPEFHRLGFGEAVENDLLTDYKVLVLNVDEGHIARSFQSQLADENNELRLEDAAKIVGCWNGLAKRPGTLIAGDGFGGDTAPMKRAVAFSRSIKDSKALAAKFGFLIEGYTEANPDALSCEVSHVDGTYNSLRRKTELDWLKADPPEGTCRILSNARCLSEGVDVPNLDAVLFLNPRNSVVDVVQSVGRVMRKSPGKNYGYIILPVAIPAGMDPAEALRDNKRYKVVWQVLQALRAHDDRFNAMVNQIELNKRDPAKIDVIGIGGGPGDDPFGDGDGTSTSTQGVLDFPIEDWRDAIFARIILKVGERAYWERWTDDIKLIAERHVTRIQAAVADPATPKAEAFERFVQELRANLNPGITPTDAIDMLAQHLITRPVFDALFGSYEFSEHNPVSLSMQSMLDELDDQALGKEAETLESFYEGVRRRAEGIDNHDGRQTVITELYERFFKKALPKTADAFGIVYTPIPVVDFILRATNDALKEHFDTDLSAEGVQILDPFTGTGTFIVRLLQSGLIRPEDLLRKYTSELHANEILLLAYYIAAINIEAAFHQRHEGSYTPFEGIVLTDTFQMAEDTATLDAKLFPENNERVARQKAQDIRVIIGNPPYSAGQTSENDGNKNQPYPALDRRIEASYVSRSSAGLSRSMYDSYVRAFRWASDRIGEGGVVCFVSNGGWIESNSADGLRLALAEEFDAIFVYNLRGNTRTAGEQALREGGQIFGAGSRNTVAVMLLVKTPGGGGAATIHYHDIGDYLAREQKLELIDQASLGSLAWTVISPNVEGDWTLQRSSDFASFIPVGHKPRGGEKPEAGIFDLYSLGVVTNRDAWCWGTSRAQVGSNISRMAGRVNDQIAAFQAHASKLVGTDRRKAVEDFIDLDKTRVSWTRALKDRVARNQPVTFDPDRLVVGSYRPFCRQVLYFDRALNEMVYQQPRIYPSAEATNLGFTLTGPSSHYEFGVLATTSVPDLHLLDTGQYFPRYRYTDPDDGAGSLFESSGPERVHNVNADTLAAFSKALGRDVSADEVFFYTYGLLHSPDYRSRYRADLKRQLPRIPIVTAFDHFADAGRKLVDLHVGYETVEPYPLGDPSLDTLIEDPSRLRVEKMAYAKKGKEKDRTSIVYNRHITLTGIPEEAHRYLLGPKSAVEWVMERYQVKTDKASGIVNDPNAWCDETGDPRYIIDLVKRVVTVSVDTMAIVDALPPLEIIEGPAS